MSREPLQSLFVLGSSHHQAPLELRERFALSTEESQALQQELCQLQGMRECLVLNTCNRVEIYGISDGPIDEDRIRTALCKHNEIERALFDPHSFWHTNLDTLQHALEVASGLQSQMVGETDILNQMKQAYLSAKSSGATGTILNRLFEKSFQAAKSARTQTGITKGQVSIGNVAVDLASRIFGRLDDSRVLLIGSGQVGENTAKALKSRGVNEVVVTSRNFEKAHQLARSLNGAAVDFADFKSQLKNYDIIISSTSAPGILLESSIIAEAQRQRPERPLFCIDLALPRDIDPKVEDLENIYLYNLDDLSSIANENLAQRKAEIERAREILKSYAWTLWLELRRRTLLP